MSVNARIEQAAALHRNASAIAQAAAAALDGHLPAPRTDLTEQHDLIRSLADTAARLTPGWLGAPLTEAPTAPLGSKRRPELVRIGAARLTDSGTSFPAIVPLLGSGHLTFTADARDPRVAATLRAVLLRLLATAPAGTLIVRTVDASGGKHFAAFSPLAEAGVMPPPVTDRAGLAAVLTEAEHWVRPQRPDELRKPAVRPRRRDCTMLLVIAALPEIEPAMAQRITALAESGPAAGLHLIVAGAQPEVPASCQVALRTSYALLGIPDQLDLPIQLDADPPAELIGQVCRELAARFAEQGQVHLMDLLPDPDHWWAQTSAAGLSTTVGLAGQTPVQLRFSEMVPHWLIGGRPDSGRTSFLVNVLYGLCTRYDPEQLHLYLVGWTNADFTPAGGDESWVPQVRAVGDCLTELTAEVTRRAAQKQAERKHAVLPRIVCVIGPDASDIDTGQLATLAAQGRSTGAHLILCADAARGAADLPYTLFPVRVALPGGGDVLAATNDSASALPVGCAVVNTAGGLGGPRGATRGHEKIVRFPDPHADRQILNALRQRLWQARDPSATPPRVYPADPGRPA